MKNYIDIFDCYAGCGGLSAGFMNEGYKIKYANEIDENFASTYLSYHSPEKSDKTYSKSTFYTISQQSPISKK